MPPTPNTADALFDMLQYITRSALPFILFAIGASAAAKQAIELVIAALSRRIQVSLGLIGLAVFGFNGGLVWAAYYNWFELLGSVNQGPSLDAEIAGLQSAPQVVQFLALVPMWTKVALTFGLFFLLLIARSLGRRPHAPDVASRY